MKLRASLTHLAIVSWAVPAEPLAAMLPRQLVPLTIDADGRWALVSLASMLDRTLGQTYPQLNERTYVARRANGERGAFFWLSRADTWQATVFSAILGIPEKRERLHLAVRGSRYSFTWHGRPVIELDLAADTARQSEHDVQRAVAVGLNPMVGYTMGRRGLERTRVIHTEIERRDVRPVYVDQSFMEAAPLIRDARPIAAWYIERTPFHIDLPPRRVLD